MGLSFLLGSSSTDQRRESRPKPASSRTPSSSASVSSSAASHTPPPPPLTTTSATTSDPDLEYIHDDLQLQAPPPECPDLRELNNCLEALAAVFPDVQIEVFREMLTKFDGESRLAVVADALLKNRVQWVKGRWRVVEGAATSAATPDAAPVLAVHPKETFKSEEYKTAVKALAKHEFRGLSRSTLHAVLAECNYNYLDARKTLVELSSKSWRFTFSSLFSRRKPVVAAAGETENHPLIVWKSTGHGSIKPTLKATGSPELDRELHEALIRPLKQRARRLQVEKDRGLAVLLNNEEAEDMDAMHECCCCFTESAFEEFAQCDADGHMICFRCVQHSIAEAVFGQGWQSTIDMESGTLKCMAVDGGGCGGRIPSYHMHRAMLEEKKGAEILHKLDQRLAQHSLLASDLPLVRCPFCDYAEVDDLYVPRGESPLRLRPDGILNLLLLVVCVVFIPFFLPLIVLTVLTALLVSSKQSPGDQLREEWSAALTRHRRRRRGLKFTCQSPTCRRASCLSCGKSWTDIHVCHESSLVALRTQIEQAMSMAVKRVCPRCGTSFVKNAGCNKLTCPCGYKMCYVCRKDIGSGPDGGEGYRHFCDHFRPDGDPSPCAHCDRCNLWESEDTDAVLQAAKEEAERKWREAERRDVGRAERDFLETGFVAAGRDEVKLEGLLRQRRPPTLAEFCDWAVGSLFG
ncbi:hypothetical protein SODALDRAFT_333343 [Sodiomyces alkalinus F11]|uniref:RING-type domain-containing protein n=1 Tax=Sodiomyces alkalinus (strain CBS 110278 / VKM F-3762 / F11) TaxID=1314773 RepID=A0A3N2PW46_SODAK|nr:hypothetical protein SODALDRAFT_333343 [Sodiomyces alkalinus F11]ROT38721.1 hypothetical protein SODALDRAFT_333343 [Sodiomyces alkalinus F11]